MSKPPFQCGRLVISTQGRDSGRPFIILSMVDEGFALIADGDLRKVERPKKKKTKHLSAKPPLIPMSVKMANSDVRKAIQAAMAENDRTNNSKEGCALVKR